MSKKIIFRPDLHKYPITIITISSYVYNRDAVFKNVNVVFHYINSTLT